MEPTAQKTRRGSCPGRWPWVSAMGLPPAHASLKTCSRRSIHSRKTHFQFTNGRGEFYDQELFQGAAIYVRFVFSDITPTSFRLEQSFSADGGKTAQVVPPRT